MEDHHPRLPLAGQGTGDIESGRRLLREIRRMQDRLNR